MGVVQLTVLETGAEGIFAPGGPLMPHVTGDPAMTQSPIDTPSHCCSLLCMYSILSIGSLNSNLMVSTVVPRKETIVVRQMCA